LGSFYSDHPDDDSLYELPRFVEEVEQVRLALELHRDNFYLLGHSWGGILAIEYALKYQHNLKGLVISNMMSSIPTYVDYANTVRPANSRNGTAARTWPTSPSARSSSALNTTRWIRNTWNGCRNSCRKPSTFTVRTAVTWTCTTTRKRT